MHCNHCDYCDGSGESLRTANPCQHCSPTEPTPRRTSTWRFEGTNRSGTNITGYTTAPPDVFVESRYKAGWRRLIVVDVSDPDTVVGEIYRRPATRARRHWWAERTLDIEDDQ